MPIHLFAAGDLSSIFTLQSAYVVAALIVIEGLLSVDNALAIAALASHLDEKRRKIAMTFGYALAYGFRILALLLANFVVNNHYLMFLGSAYLIWLMCNHFADAEDAESNIEADQKPQHSFGKTIALIAFLDLSLSFDNVVAAVAFARDNIYLVYLGVTIGIITLRMVAGYCIKLLDRHPWLEHTAFLLVGFVGCMLCFELYWDQFVKMEFAPLGITIIEGQGGHFHIQKPVKFGGIFLIIIGHMTYEQFPFVRTTCRPVVMASRTLFATVARFINALFSIITWPVRRLYRASQKNTARAGQ